MEQVRTRWPGLSAIPRARIATLPTPVTRLERISARTGAEVWAKRDDRTAPAYGGNKVRKLEHLLGDARLRKADVLITIGALGSHHVLATSLYGAREGFRVRAVMLPQPWNEHVEADLRVDLACGTVLTPARGFAHGAAKMLAIAATERARGRKPYLIPPGGSSPVGAVAYVEAGIELAEQIDRGELPEPDAIYVALGSAGTIAGLSIGLAAAGITARVVGVRVTDRLVFNRALLSALVQKTLARVRSFEPRFPSVAALALEHIAIDDSQFGEGYGHPTTESAEAERVAREEASLELDPTYTAKTFAALLRDAAHARRGERLLFWNTLSSAEMAPLLAGAPPAPGWARKLGGSD